MTATVEKIQAVITANRQRQQRSRELNERAGETVFPVLSFEQVSVWLAERLGGARRIVEIGNADALKFPELDPDLETIVLRENPDAIIVLGKEHKVEYRQGYTPGLALDRELVAANRWLELPDDGVKLPGGRLVSVTLWSGYSSVYGTDIPKLKEQARNHLNQEQWDRWTIKPAIPLPDPNAEDVTIPEITTAEYGKCAITGESLTAYGAVAPRYRYHSSDPWFEAHWYRSREEAERVRTSAFETVEKLKAEARAKAEAEKKRVETAAARELAEAAQKKVRVVYDRDSDNRDIPSDLRSRLYSKLYAYLPSDLDGLKVWVADAEALVAEADAALVEIQKRKEEEQRLKLEAEARAAERRGELKEILAKHYALCPVCSAMVKWAEIDLGNYDAAAPSWELDFCNCLYYKEGSEAERLVGALDSGYVGPYTRTYAGRTATVYQRSSFGETPFAEVLLYHKYGTWNMRLMVSLEALSSTGEARSETLWREPRDIELRLLELKRQREQAAEELARAQQDETWQPLRLRFRKGKHPHTGEEQWESSGRGVKYVLDRWCRVALEESRAYLAREVKTLVETPTFRLIAVQVMLSPEELDAEIARVEQELDGTPAASVEASAPAAPTAVGGPASPVFVDEGKRYFRCPKCSAASARLTATEYQAYKDGSVVSVQCPACRTIGTAKK